MQEEAKKSSFKVDLKLLQLCKRFELDIYGIVANVLSKQRRSTPQQYSNKQTNGAEAWS